MKKPEETDGEMRAEYDFETMPDGVRGKYHQRVTSASNLVLLDPDVAKAFPTPEAVNRALRLLAEVAEETSSDR